MAYLPWWERSPKILEHELAALEWRGLDFRIDEEQKARGRIVARGRAPAGPAGDFDVEVRYPDTFPNGRPEILQVGDYHWLGRHQHPRVGLLCLLGRGNGHWRPSMTAADVLDGLPDLVRVVGEGGAELIAAEDPQGEPVSAYLPYENVGGVIVPRSSSRIPIAVRSGTFVLALPPGGPCILERCLVDGEAGRGQVLLAEVSDQDGTVVSTADPELARLYAGERWEGRWARAESTVATAHDPFELLDRARAIENRICRDVKLRRPLGVSGRLHVGALVLPDEVRQGEHEDAWVFLGTARLKARSKDGDKPATSTRVRVFRGLRYSREGLSVRVPSLAPARKRSAMCVGLGSLGAPIVRLLAQGQVGRLFLIDDDHVDAETTVRWPAGLSAAGWWKADYLHREIARDHPFVEVDGWVYKIGETSSEEPGGPRLAEEVERADVVVDATAEDEVSRTLAAIADASGTPQVYVWSNEGYGGVVARVRPGATGCFHCLSLHLSDGGIPSPPAPGAGAERRIQPAGCTEPTFAAPSFDLLPLANQAARAVFATFTNAPESLADGDVSVLRLYDADGSVLPVPEWSAHPLDPHPRCAACSA